MLKYQDFGVVHLPTFNSDHNPLWLRAGNMFQTPNPKPFRFLATWLTHSEFNSLVSNCWNPSIAWNDNVSNFTHTASIWNRDVFGHIQKQKHRL